jgi:hypothetical protein
VIAALLFAMLADAPQAAAAPATPAPCRSTDGEIVVCGPAPDPLGRSRYRLPTDPGGYDPEGVTDSVATERFRLIDVGDAGTGSCSTIGGGGWTGCQVREWRIDEYQGKGDRKKQDRVTVGIGFSRDGQ